MKKFRLWLLPAALSCAAASLVGVKTAGGHAVEEKEKLNYVSLGDSMSTGFGYNDYYADDEAKAEVADTDFKWEDGHKNVHGFLNEAEESYAALVKDYLASANPDKDVVWTQLANNCTRVDDIYYNLVGEFDDAKTDEYFKDQFDATKAHSAWNKIFAERAVDLGYTAEASANETVHKVFYDAVENADVITLSAGYNNFGGFVSGKLNDLIELPAFSGMFEGWGGNDTLESFLERVDLGFDIEAIYNQVMSILTETLKFDLSSLEEISLPGVVTIHTKKVIEMIVLAVADYCYYINELTKAIYEINEDVELVVIGFQDMLKGYKVSVLGMELDLSEILSKVYEVVNLYTATVPQMANKYKFVDLTGVEVTRHIDDLAANSMSEDQIQRLYTGVFELIEKLGVSMPAMEDMINGVNALLSEKYSTPVDFTQELPCDWTVKEALLACVYNEELDLGEQMQGINQLLAALQRAAGKNEIDLTSALFIDFAKLIGFESGTFDGLLKIFLGAVLNNGVWIHPNAAGHAVIAEKVVAALESKQTAIQYGFSVIFDKIVKVLNPYAPFIESVIQKVTEIAEKVGLETYTAISEIVDAVKAKVAEFKVAIESAVNEVERIVSFIKASIQKAQDESRIAILNFYDSVVDGAKELVKKLVGFIPAFETALSVVGYVALFAVGGSLVKTGLQVALKLAGGLLSEVGSVVTPLIVALNPWLLLFK